MNLARADSGFTQPLLINHSGPVFLIQPCRQACPSSKPGIELYYTIPCWQLGERQQQPDRVIMAGREPDKPKAMKNGIVYTRDFEIVEMSELTVENTRNQFASSTSYTVSANSRHIKSSQKGPFIRRWLDSFKRVEGVPISGHHGYHINDGLPEPAQFGDRLYDVRAANSRTANSGLARDLKGRHLQMIAIGGSIGTSARGGRPRSPQTRV
jgi:hypothetical protein